MNHSNSLTKNIIAGTLSGVLAGAGAMYIDRCQRISEQPSQKSAPDKTTTLSPSTTQRVQTEASTFFIITPPPEKFCQEITNQLRGHLQLINTIAIQNSLCGEAGIEIGLLQPKTGNLSGLLLPSESTLTTCDSTTVGFYLRELAGKIAGALKTPSLSSPLEIPEFEPPSGPTRL